MRKILKLNIFHLVEKIVRFHVDCGPQIRVALSLKHANSEVQKPTDDCVFRCCQSS